MREQRCHFGTSGWDFTLWDWFFESTKVDTCLGRGFIFASVASVSRFLLPSLTFGANNPPCFCSLIYSDWGTMCRITPCLTPHLRWLWFPSTWAINGIHTPCGLEGRVAVLIVSCVPAAAPPEPDGWCGQDMADWEASRLRADVAYALVISRECSW